MAQSFSLRIKILIFVFFVVGGLYYLTTARGLFAVGNSCFGGTFYNIRCAEFFFDRAYERDKKLAGLNYQLSRVYFLRGDFYMARRAINEEIRLYPDYFRSYYIRGLVNGYAKDFPGAVSDFKEFLKYKEESWAGHNDLSWIYFQMGDFKNAESIARAGLIHSPYNPWLLNSLGIALINEKKYTDAVTVLSEGLVRLKALTPAQWGKAYPGNDPAIYKEGFTHVIEVVEANLSLAKSKAGGP